MIAKRRYVNAERRYVNADRCYVNADHCYVNAERCYVNAERCYVQDLRIDRNLTMCVQAHPLFEMFQYEVTSHLKRQISLDFIPV
ncbi:MAG: hypothetical protein KME22_27255, partial [Hassallia sp. WJT32-NPBG1]|nr:hypothetical protein [Hassallia sp. WJT32-NPBG1]